VKRTRKRQLLFNSWMNGRGNSGKRNSFFAKKEARPEKQNKVRIEDDIIMKRIEKANEECNIIETKFLNNDPKEEFNELKEEDNKKEINQINASLNATSSKNQSFKRKRSINVISSRDIRTAFMLFVISFLYICFFSPSLISTYITLLNSKTETESYGDSASESRIIITYLYFSNSAINPIIYCFLNPNFRADLIKLFFKRGSIYSSCTKHFNSLK